MLNYLNFIHLCLEDQVNKEIEKYSFSEEQFFNLQQLVETDLNTARHNVNVWHTLKNGAKEYFSAGSDEQKRLHHDADKLNHTKLFTDEKANPKLAKNGVKMPEYHTKGLFLAPSTMSGVDVCPAASKECKASCLGSKSGRAHMEPVKQSRIKRTHFMLHNPKHFYAKLDNEITAAKKAAHKNGQKLAVRLNGTSDIPHEHVAPDLFKKHHDVQFYDYTKVSGRVKHKDLPKNYHLTLSSTGLNHKDSNWKQVRNHLDNGGVASMVFKAKTAIKGKREAGELPTHVHDEETGKKYRVIDGDEHDHRHLDHSFNGVSKHEGVIAGLRLKGGPKNLDRAGNFAVDVNEHGHALAKKGEN